MNVLNIKKTLNNQKGFTLIEIISVLVILGILAAYALPKFSSLQDDARNKAALAAVAEGAARMQAEQARLLLSIGKPEAAATVSSNLTANHTDAGDFTISYTRSGDIITISALGKSDTPAAGGTASKAYTVLK